MKSKIITLHSPVPKVGQTTIANLLATTIAQAGKYVLLVEMSKHTGYSVYLNSTYHRNYTTLNKALLNPDSISQNLVQSKYNSKFNFLCHSFESLSRETQAYNPVNVDKMLKQVIDAYDYILLDLPSELTEPITARVFKGEFTLPISHHLEIIDENVECMKRLNELGEEILSTRYDKEERFHSSLIVNKSLKLYSPYFAPHMENIPFIEIDNIIDIPYIDGYTYLCNEGQMLSIGKSPAARDFAQQFKLIYKLLESKEVGVGNILSRTVDPSKIVKEKKKSLFSSKKKKKEPKGKPDTKKVVKTKEADLPPRPVKQTKIKRKVVVKRADNNEGVTKLDN